MFLKQKKIKSDKSQKHFQNEINLNEQEQRITTSIVELKAQL